MSGAHDARPPVYPDKQGEHEPFAFIFDQYHQRIRKYFAMKLDSTSSEDLTQQVFLKAMENYHTFRQDSSLFTWLYTIAHNTLKNEFRKRSRTQETSFDGIDWGSKFITLDFANNLEIRIDMSAALKKLGLLDQQIITLRFFVDCTLSEIAEIVHMRESAVKNRLYRSLEKLRSELKDWKGLNHMSIQKMISIVSKNTPEGTKNESQTNVYEDLFNELNVSVNRLAAKLNHQPTKKVVIELYPDLPTFHAAVGEADAPDWFMGTYEDNIIKMVSPLNPGPEHTYQSILKSATHLFAMWLVTDINPRAPRWIRQGLGGYEADQMSQTFIKDSIRETVRKGSVPTLHELENDSFELQTTGGFQFSYKMVEFIVKEHGLDSLNKIIRNPDDFQGIFHCSEAELRAQWIAYLTKQL
ncbi:RNA polymerase sigma factor [Paenibacillus mendelii]|uniref:RNA polymerase sigma factor n=1 Tax=Paenibacillus mendelii TaxID=206163 RepID=A0ABV6J2S5_9BACL|nr:sigma-70 family RNA polymerase sigma factor [Paenibacillus mendelii]MCQ6559297.1 sigma-70 family RNA polymerase sigma factor [Paenibacillus mendelii]